MAKFRKNHSYDSSNSSGKRGKTPSKSIILRSVFFFIGVCVIIYLLTKVEGDSWQIEPQDQPIGNKIEISDEKGTDIESNFYPESTTGQVIVHKYYALSYSEEHEQPEWVAYKLTESNLRKPRVKREKRFRQDDLIHTLSAKHNDYSHSGYTRGHLAPAGDMAFSKDAMRESFYMSNMSPQLKEFNGGIWRELEENVRNWAYDNDELYIVTGPILTKGHIIKTIGYNEVSVPDQFYKIILDLKMPEQKAIAFLMPNKKSVAPIKEYVVSIDDIEDLTGINFFADFLTEEQETELEKMTNASKWKFDPKKFKTRIEKWNNY